MARRFLAISPWPGAIAAGVLALFAFGTLVAVALRADSGSGLGPFDLAALRFTVMQAAMSAALSVVLAAPVARALARRTFAGRGLLIALMGAPFVLPVIVAVLGLTAVFGRNGPIAQMAIWAGFEPFSIYGLQGILLAHVFFNLPLATRLILQGWQEVPAEQMRLAASLGFGRWDMFRHIEMPMLRRVLPGAAAAIFLICTTSFAVALTFGGGPAATTIELAIYEAFRFDVDLGRAAILALMQFGIGIVAVVITLRVVLPDFATPRRDRTQVWHGAQSGWTRGLDGCVIGLAALFLILPLALLALRGVSGFGQLDGSIGAAAVRSVGVALVSTVLTLVLVIALSLAVLRWNWVESLGLVTISTSPLVMGTGLFLIVYPFVDPRVIALPVTVAVNAIMSVPFALRAILPALRSVEADFGRLGDALGLVGLARLRWLVLPRLRRPIGFAAGLTAALSMGDLGVITLFADPDAATLPLKVYQLMSAYRMDQAMAAALVLLALTLGLFYLFDRWGQRDDRL